MSALGCLKEREGTLKKGTEKSGVITDQRHDGFREGDPWVGREGRTTVTQRRDVCVTGPVVASQHGNRLFAA